MPVFFTTPTFARAGVVASFVLTPPGLDLVFNPFFESGIGWTWVNAYLDTSFYEPIDFCHSSIRLNLNAPTAYVTEVTPHPVTPAQVYDLAVDVFSTGWPGEQNIPPTTMPASWTNLGISGPHEPTGTMELEVQFWDATGLTLISTVSVTTQTPTGGLWVTMSGSVTVPAGAAGMTILIVLSGETEQDWWLDNVQLQLQQSAFVPDITIGVLFAQGTMYAPTLPPVLPAAPAPTGGALSLQSWLWYNSSTGFYWSSSSSTPTTAGDAALGWVATNATGIAANSTRRIGSGLPQVITPVGPVTAPLVPPAPNVASATATVAAVTVGAVAYYQFSGTFVNFSDTTNVGQVQVVMENITGTPFDVPIQTFFAPLVAGATVNWLSALMPTPTSGGTLTFKPAFRSSNLIGTVTSPEVNEANLTVTPVAGPSSATPEPVYSVALTEVGPRWLDTADQTTWTTLQLVIEEAITPGSGYALGTRLHVGLSSDNVNWADEGWSTSDRVDEDGTHTYYQTTVTIPNVRVNVMNVTWYARAYAGGTSIDPGWAAAVESAGCVVALIGAPSATGLVSFSASAATDLGPVIDGWFMNVAFTTPGNGDANCWAYQITVQSVNAAGGANPDPTIGTERAFQGGNNNGGAYPWVLDGTYVAAGSAYTYVRFKVYGISRSATATPEWSDPTYAVLQQIAGSATSVSVNFGSDPGTYFGDGVTRGSAGGVRGTAQAISILRDYSFEAVPVGAVGASTVSPWAFAGNVSIVSGGAADGAQYCQLQGPSASAAQTISVRAGESLYVGIYYFSSNTSGSHSFTLTLTFLNSAGATVGSVVTAVTESGFVSGWSLTDTSVAVPATAVKALVTISTGASEPSAGTWGIDAVRIDAVRRAANIALGAGLGNDGAGNTQVKRGAGVTVDGSNNVTLNLGAGVTFSSSLLETALGSGMAFDGSNNVTINVGTGVKLSGGQLQANLGNGLTASGGAITLNLGNGMQISGGALTVNLGSGLSASGGAITLQLGNGITISGGLVTANLGSGLTASGGVITLNLGSGLTISGSVVQTNVSGGLTYSGVSIVIASGGVGPTQIASVNASQINAGTVTVGSGGMTFSGTGGILISGSGNIAVTPGNIAGAYFKATQVGGTGQPAYYVGSTLVIDAGANANFATLDVQGSVRIDASGNVNTNNCNVFGSLNFEGSTSTTANSGAASLPSNPVGFVWVQVFGTAYKMAYYAT